MPADGTLLECSPERDPEVFRAARVGLGAQPVWDPRNWPAAVAKRGSLRAQFNRARNKGVIVTEWSSEKAENHPALRRVLSQVGYVPFENLVGRVAMIFFSAEQPAPRRWPTIRSERIGMRIE